LGNRQRRRREVARETVFDVAAGTGAAATATAGTAGVAPCHLRPAPKTARDFRAVPKRRPARKSSQPYAPQIAQHAPQK
jgi:hypothetical protein